MCGIILFWLMYIVSAIIIYHLISCIYVKGRVDSGHYRNKYFKTNEDKRLKHPLYFIVLMFVCFVFPIVNIGIPLACLLYRVCSEDGQEHNKYYCKSIFTKEY